MAQLARKTGLSARTIANAENGKDIRKSTEELILSKIYDNPNWKPFAVTLPKKNDSIFVLWANGNETFEVYPFEESENNKAIFWK